MPPGAAIGGVGAGVCVSRSGALRVVAAANGLRLRARPHPHESRGLPKSAARASSSTRAVTSRSFGKRAAPHQHHDEHHEQQHPAAERGDLHRVEPEPLPCVRRRRVRASSGFRRVGLCNRSRRRRCGRGRLFDRLGRGRRRLRSRRGDGSLGGAAFASSGGAGTAFGPARVSRASARASSRAWARPPSRRA